MRSLGATPPANASGGRVDMRSAVARLALAANRSKLPNPASTSTSSCFSTSSARSPSSGAGSRSRDPRFSSFATTRAEAASTSAQLENLAASSPKRPPRFFVEPSSLPSSTATAGTIVSLPPAEARHARKVLRLRPGATVELCDGRGNVSLGRITEQRSKGDPLAVELSSGPPTRIPAPSPRLALAVAALGLKGGRGDWLVEKAAELGAASLVPLATERSPDGARESDDDEGEERRRRRQRSGSSPSPPSPSSPRAARWSRLAEAAGKQCLRAHALEVSPLAVSVGELARRIRAERPLLALVAAEGGPPVADVVLDSFPRREKSERETRADPDGGESDVVYLVVGPEGDFTPSELEALVSAGAKPCGLGSNRLRVETASEALLAVVSALLS